MGSKSASESFCDVSCGCESGKRCGSVHDTRRYKTHIHTDAGTNTHDADGVVLADDEVPLLVEGDLAEDPVLLQLSCVVHADTCVLKCMRSTE